MTTEICYISILPVEYLQYLLNIHLMADDIFLTVPDVFTSDDIALSEVNMSGYIAVLIVGFVLGSLSLLEVIDIAFYIFFWQIVWTGV